FFQAEDGIRDRNVTGVQTCALPISRFLRLVLVDDRPEIEGPVEELIRRFPQRVAHLHLAHVVLHVLGVPPARVGDERERRKDKRSEERRVGKECRTGWWVW